MTKCSIRLMLSLVTTVGLWKSPVLAQSTLPIPTTESDQVGPLRIHITAVQGHTQYRVDDNAKWQTVTVGLDVIEGVEFRTGPKGAIQFTVGTDQVYRVDRLTAVKILRASLMPDGTIRTDVGMTYGRVSKDVNLPPHPHQDTIVSPSTTLAVRGTRVSLYDQPPYEPEAVSLTGAAVYTNVRGQLVQFGSKGGGTVKVAGSADNAAQYRLQSIQIDPLGAFSGRSDSEQAQLNYLTGLGGVFNSLQIVRGAPDEAFVIGSVPLQGELFFQLVWTNGPPSTIVDYTVTSPLNETVSMTMPMAPSGGSYNTNLRQSNVAGPSGTGFQEIDWGGILGSTFPTGIYTLTETLTGTTTQTLAQNPNVSVTAIQSAQQMLSNGFTAGEANASATLNARNPTASYQLTVPNSTNLVQIKGNPATITGDSSLVRRRR